MSFALLKFNVAHFSAKHGMAPTMRSRPLSSSALRLTFRTVLGPVCALPASRSISRKKKIPASVDESLKDEPHVPVLLDEIRDLFRDVQMRVYVDGTLGAAGHACAIASDHPELEALVGIDQDPVALAIATDRLEALAADRRARAASGAAASTPNLTVHIHRGNFRELGDVLRSLGLYGEVDGLLLDLGMSSMQIDSDDRGFSFMRDAPLDMRMNPEAALSAEAIVNTWGESEIGRIIREYGEDNQWRLLAKKIVQYRDRVPITTTFQLLEAMHCSPTGARGWKGPHPATRTFQALRIAVNDELGVLRDVLPEALAALRPGGRLGVISFHSLEDRMVKRAFARACGRIVEEDGEDVLDADPSARARYVSTVAIPKEAPPATHRLVVRKVVTASDTELVRNSRARSAKYRIVERLGGDDERRAVDGGLREASPSERRARGSGEETSPGAPAPFKSKYAMKKAAAAAAAEASAAPGRATTEGGSGSGSGSVQRQVQRTKLKPVAGPGPKPTREPMPTAGKS